MSTITNITSVTFRPANLSDIALLQYWDQQPHVIAAHPNDQWNWRVELKQSPAWRKMLIAEDGGRPIGFVQIIDPAKEESRYWGDITGGFRALDIWIGEESDLGQGYGTVMMEQILALCFEDTSVIGVLVDPLADNTRSHRFYERFGFQFAERRQFGRDDCFVYLLSRDDWMKRTVIPDSGK